MCDGQSGEGLSGGAMNAMTGSVVLASGFEPNWRAREDMALMKYRSEDGWDEEPPPKRPGDGWIVVCTIVGLVAGAAAGFVVNTFLTIAGVLVGGLLGAAVGGMLKALISRRRRNRIQQSRPRGAPPSPDRPVDGQEA